MPEYCLRVCDIETTGFLEEQPANIQAEPRLGLVELGWTDVLVNVSPDNKIKGVEVGDRFGALLFKPPGGIPPEASAVHHLRDRDVADAQEATPGVIQLLANSPPWRGPDKPMALVAHNAEFERAWLAQYLPKDLHWICSMKVAAQMFRDWPSMGNQALKYRLGLELPEALCHPPHRAGPDSFVTAHLVAQFILRGASVRQMIEWTRLPRLYPTFPFGDHKGKEWSAIDAGMLRWTIDNVPKHKNADAAYWSKVELERRATIAADPAMSGDYG